MEKNWGGNVVYRAGTVHRPRSVPELAAVVSLARNVRVIGTRHTFNDLPDSAELIDLHALPFDFAIAPSRSVVRVSAHVTYGALAQRLDADGLALANMASLPHISIAGALATGTHGSGDGNGVLATAVRAVEILRADGELVEVRRGDADFDGTVVSLGALGILTHVSLDVEPAFRMTQHVFESLSWDRLLDGFDDIFGAAYSVSAFTRWGADVGQLWLKQRVGGAMPVDSVDGAIPAVEHRHPLLGLGAQHCTPQLGEPGPWFDRLPHFRLGFNPSGGEEMQSEFFVDRSDARAAIDALRSLGPALDKAILVGEIRTVAADEHWLSPAYGRNTVAFNFTWRLGDASTAAAYAVGAALAPFGARPHWGKVFDTSAFDDSLFVRRADFANLVATYDPAGTFRNDFLDRTILRR